MTEEKKEKKISDEKLQKKIKFFPFEKQKEIINCDKRDIVICAGRRFGKSAVCGYIALKELLMKNKRIWIVAPTYDLAMKVFEYVVRFYVLAAPNDGKNRWIRGISHRPIPQIRTPWGSILQCKSTENPAGLLGEEVDLMIVDEAAQIPRRMYEEYLYPATTSRKGKTIFISTPLGQNWFYQKFMAAKEREDSAVFHFQSKENPYLPEGEWERAKELLPRDSFLQNYEAVFLSGAASVFRGIEEIIDYSLKNEEPEPSELYTMGVDLGKHRDFTVLTVIKNRDGRVVYFDRFNKIDWNFQKTKIVSVAKKYNARVFIDSTGIGDPIKDDLEFQGLFIEDFKFTNQSKANLIQKLSMFIEQKRISIPNNEYLVEELQSFGYNISGSGKIIYSAPEGLHDDCVYSLALAVWGIDIPVFTKNEENIKIYNTDYL
ncbi:MAG: terminase large subunit [Candidatus Pacearchaeota archaeon]